MNVCFEEKLTASIQDMNRAAHQHGVLESFILRHSSPKILKSRLPAFLLLIGFYI
jgi:hypothetical protein